MQINSLEELVGKELKDDYRALCRANPEALRTGDMDTTDGYRRFGARLPQDVRHGIEAEEMEHLLHFPAGENMVLGIALAEVRETRQVIRTEVEPEGDKDGIIRAVIDPNTTLRDKHVGLSHDCGTYYSGMIY